MKPARVVSILLLLEITAYYLFPKAEIPRAAIPLEQLPAEAGDWVVYTSRPVEPEINEVLKADSTLSRIYLNRQGTRSLSLFIAYFKTQSAGVAPHSPKNCLPGSGWVPTESRTATIAVNGRAEPIEVNQYVVQQGANKSLVLYWYQTGDRVIASEYSAKLYTAADRFLRKRSDTSIVRVTVPFGEGDAARAQEIAERFTRSIFPQVVELLPK